MDLDQFHPHVTVPLAQIYRGHRLVVVLKDQHLALVQEGGKELPLLCVFPGPVCALDEITMGRVMQLEQPLMVGGCDGTGSKVCRTDRDTYFLVRDGRWVKNLPHELAALSVWAVSGPPKRGSAARRRRSARRPRSRAPAVLLRWVVRRNRSWHAAVSAPARCRGRRRAAAPAGRRCTTPSRGRCATG